MERRFTLSTPLQAITLANLVNDMLREHGPSGVDLAFVTFPHLLVASRERVERHDALQWPHRRQPPAERTFRVLSPADLAAFVDHVLLYWPEEQAFTTSRRGYLWAKLRPWSVS